MTGRGQALILLEGYRGGVWVIMVREVAKNPGEVMPMPASEKRIAVGSDERTHLTDQVLDSLRKRGYQIELFGALGTDSPQWPLVGQHVAQRVASGACQQGVLFCWTGTGVAMAANKTPGARAALCTEAQTAAGARKWNDANILCMSLRLTSAAVAEEILNAWFSTPVDEAERANIEILEEMDTVPAGR